MSPSELDLFLSELELIHKAYRLKITRETSEISNTFSISFLIKKTEWRTIFEISHGNENKLHGIVNRAIATKLIEEVANTL